MHIKTIYTTCAVLAAFSGLANADINYDLAEIAQNKLSVKDLSISAGLGYETKYVSRGMAFADADTDNIIPLEAIAVYGLTNNYTLLGGLKYQWMTANHLTHNNHTGYCDEGTGIFGIARTFNNTTLAFSYQFVHGGIGGFLNGHRRDGHPTSIPAFDHNRPEEHSFVFDVHHEFSAHGLKNFFFDSRIQYTFQWQEGWWFTNSFGYKHTVNDKLSLIGAATWNATMGYFDRYTDQVNGTQAISLTLKAPYRVNDNLTLTPFCGMHWLGNGGISANKRQAGDVYRNFTINVGVGATYNF